MPLPPRQVVGIPSGTDRGRGRELGYGGSTRNGRGLHMTINDYGASSSGQSAARKLNEIQADLVSTARLWAVDEVGAVMAHQLYEPLTALLLYLHELKRRGVGDDANDPAGNMIEKALSETERVCDIMEQIGRGIE